MPNRATPNGYMVLTCPKPELAKQLIGPKVEAKQLSEKN